MPDFLTRLAERALGIGSSVQPNLMPIFAPPSRSGLEAETGSVADGVVQRKQAPARTATGPQQSTVGPTTTVPDMAKPTHAGLDVGRHTASPDPTPPSAHTEQAPLLPTTIADPLPPRPVRTARDPEETRTDEMRSPTQAMRDETPVRTRTESTTAEPSRAVPTAPERTSDPGREIFVRPGREAPSPEAARTFIPRTRTELHAEMHDKNRDERRPDIEGTTRADRAIRPNDPPPIVPRRIDEVDRRTPSRREPPHQSRRGTEQGEKGKRSEEESRRAETEAEEPSTIRVTIGRIEVRAIMQAPQQRREPARHAPTTSLDDYLKQYSGRNG